MVDSEFKMVGFGILDWFFLINRSILSALNLASATNRALRCLASSGEYFFKSLKRTFAELYREYPGSYQEFLKIGRLRGEL